jgi:hypothetical protein
MLGGLKKWAILMVRDGIGAVCGAALPGVIKPAVRTSTTVKAVSKEVALLIVIQLSPGLRGSCLIFQTAS